MKKPTNQLTGRALRWAVAKCLTLTGQAAGFDIRNGVPHVHSRTAYLPADFDINWGHTGPVKERVGIISGPTVPGEFFARLSQPFDAPQFVASTELVAICRCYVHSVFGDVVDLPDELLVPAEETLVGEFR